MIYRFRVTFEDNEEIYREIEIKSTQHFEDFHHAIVQSISFDNIHNASFFISDDYWRKGDEITLRPATEIDNNERKKQNLLPKGQMHKSKLASLIDDPHQKFVYIYDPKTAWTFQIELLKIVPDDAKAVYPKCAKSVGEAPKQYKTINGLPPVIEDEEFDEAEPHSDDEAYTNAHSDDETALLEGEEGEEAEGEELSDAEEEDFDAPEFEGHTEDED
ncbi:MAG: hypothetical protein H0W84_14290 [Bacteroidetes bacterium]|nr:hypothetical protein [Bacteroidota bacterium]